MDQNIKKGDKRIEKLLSSDNEHLQRGFTLYKTKFKDGELQHVMTPFPNMTALYLNISDSARDKSIEIFNNVLVPSLQLKGSTLEFGAENSDSFTFDLWENIIVSIVFSYSAVESLVNNLIPNSVILFTKKNGKVKLASKDRIEKNTKLSEKIKSILPRIFEFEFKTDELPFWKDFTDLEKYRNNFIHFKSDEIDGNRSTQASLLVHTFFDITKRDLVKSARTLIQYLASKIDFVPGIPSEFIENPVDYYKYVHHYKSKKIDLDKEVNILFQDQKSLDIFKEMFTNQILEQ